MSDTTRFELQPIETAPKDGTPVLVRVFVRWLPYKKTSEQYRKGIKGRWQEWNGYGWDSLREQPEVWLKPIEREGTSNG